MAAPRYYFKLKCLMLKLYRDARQSACPASVARFGVYYDFGE
jgi:hypothetical protein